MMPKNFIVTPKTVTLVLAYLHNYTCKFLPRRCLSASNLATLAIWIGQPVPALRTVRKHKPLATHLMLLHAAGLLDIQGGYWQCMPAAFSWLEATHHAQIKALLQPLYQGGNWEQTLTKFGFHDVLPIDYLTFVQQNLEHQHEKAQLDDDVVTWDDLSASETWLLNIPDLLSTDLRFDLLQLGHWMPGQPLRCTPTTILKAAQRGYSPSAGGTIAA